MKKRLKDFFIPHEGNNYRPDFLERVSVGVMLVLIVLSFAMANLQALFWISSDWLVSTVLPSIIVDLTNNERDAESLAPLKRSTLLDVAAKLKADDMAKNEYFSHYSPTGVSPWYWFDQASYDYLNAGENLAVHFTESDEVVEAWMKSPSHRANIMSGQYADIGVGTAKGEYKGSPTIFVVQLFGSPRAPIVAGVSTEVPSSEISIEKVASTESRPDVAPASVSTQEIKPIPVIPETVPQEPVSDPTLPVTPRDTESVALYSSFASTSRAGEPLALPASLDPGEYDTVSLPLRSTTEPSLWLETLYAVLALFVVGALSTSIALEWRRHHPIQIAYAGGLLAVMALLLYIHTSLTGMVLIT